MPPYRTTVHTSWSPRQAFAYMSDLTNFAEWDPGVKRSVQVAGSGIAVGSAFDVTVGGIGRDLVLRYEIVDLVPDERVEVRAETSLLRSGRRGDHRSGGRRLRRDLRRRPVA